MIYQNIFDTEVPTEAQQQAIAAKLRGDDARATLALLSGDPALTRVGNSIKETNKEKAEGLRKTIDAIETRNAQATEAEAKRGFEGGEYQANRDQADRHHQDDLTLKREEIKADELAAAKKLIAQEEANTIAAKQVEQNNRVNYEQEKSNRGLTQMGVLVEQIENKIAPYLKEGELVGDVPGLSTVETSIADAFGQTLSSEEGVQMRALMARFSNVILKQRSGAAVTPHEFDRLQKELAKGVGASDKIIYDAYRNIVAGYKAEASNLAKAYGYEKGDISGSEVFDPKSKKGASNLEIKDDGQ